jgi:hypothetical protein
MFFTTLKEAKLHARLEGIRTGKRHRVKRTRKYINPLTTQDGPLFIMGYTIILAD